MKFITHCFSRAGTRAKNEDYAAFSCKKRRCGVWAVADGLGGHRDGEIAAECAVSTAIAEFEQSYKLDSDNIGRIMSCVNQAVRDKHCGDHGYDSMKTTIAAMFVHRGRAVFSHVGDSRVYLFRKGRIVFQTADHTLSRIRMQNGSGDVRNDSERNSLLCAIGAFEDVHADITTSIRLKKGDAVLLCTDGFWEKIFEERMQDTLSISSSPEQWLALMEHHHTKAQTQNQDNYTAMAVFVK